MRNEIKVTRNYSLWRHPIKWFQDRKKILVLNQLLNIEWKNGLREEVEKGQRDLMLFGRTFFKKGKHVDKDIFNI